MYLAEFAGPALVDFSAPNMLRPGFQGCKSIARKQRRIGRE